MTGLVFSGSEVRFSPDEIIVSKTDEKGNLTYVNQTFCTVSDFVETELLGKPHSIIRHDNMPRCVFKLIWEYVQSGREIFGYVVNKTKFGNYYWVLAHVTPSMNSSHELVGYHSNRRVPDSKIISNVISPLYAELLRVEGSYANRKEGLAQSCKKLTEILESKGLSYDEFILTIKS